jgi:hypothetical protein
VNAYKTAMAVMGTFVTIVAAAVSVIYFAFIVLPFCIVLGYVALWSISRSRSVRVPIGVAIVGAFCLISPTVVYIGNEGNWNQPGTQWLLLPLLVGIVLLCVNAFAIYVRCVAGSFATLVGGPALVVACGIAFWWLLHVDSSRADLYMYRLHAVLVCVYGLLGTILAADRLGRALRRPPEAAAGQPNRLA